MKEMKYIVKVENGIFYSDKPFLIEDKYKFPYRQMQAVPESIDLPKKIKYGEIDIKINEDTTVQRIEAWYREEDYQPRRVRGRGLYEVAKNEGEVYFESLSFFKSLRTRGKTISDEEIIIFVEKSIF